MLSCLVVSAIRLVLRFDCYCVCDCDCELMVMCVYACAMAVIWVWLSLRLYCDCDCDRACGSVVMCLRVIRCCGDCDCDCDCECVYVLILSWECVWLWLWVCCDCDCDPIVIVIGLRFIDICLIITRLRRCCGLIMIAIRECLWRECGCECEW